MVQLIPGSSHRAAVTKQRGRVGSSDLEGRVLPFKTGDSADALLGR